MRTTTYASGPLQPTLPRMGQRDPCSTSILSEISLLPDERVKTYSTSAAASTSPTTEQHLHAISTPCDGFPERLAPNASKTCLRPNKTHYPECVLQSISSRGMTLRRYDLCITNNASSGTMSGPLEAAKWRRLPALTADGPVCEAETLIECLPDVLRTRDSSC